MYYIYYYMYSLSTLTTYEKKKKTSMHSKNSSMNSPLYEVKYGTCKDECPFKTERDMRTETRYFFQTFF